MLTFTAQRLRGSLELPPDKSISQRLAIFSLLRNETTYIENYSPAADPQSALKCVEQLGAKVQIHEPNPGSVQITGIGREALFQKEVGVLNCGNSGTAMRLLSGILAGASAEAKLVGDASLSSRTMKRILDPLRAMGAVISAREDNFAPLEFSSHKGLRGIEFKLPVASAQLKSCILLAGLFAKEETCVIETAISRDHTERMLQLPISDGKTSDELHRISVSNRTPIPDLSGKVPADFSAAAFWIVAAAIHPNAELRLLNVGMNPTRNAAISVLQRMQANIEIDMLGDSSSNTEPLAHIVVKSSNLISTDILEEEMAILIDEIPALAVAMSFAQGVSHIRGAEELRHKETDRIDAVSHMLSQAKVPHKTFQDGLEIQGNPKHSFNKVTFESYHDHRIAMSAAVLALRANEICEVKGGECANISYPSFWDDLKKLCR